MTGRQKAIVLSYHQPPNLSYLVQALNKHDYDVVLMITGRGPNYALSDDAYEQMSAQIAGVFNAYDFPILAVKNMTQAKPFILSMDANAAFCLGFPYPITPDLLSTRTTFVNFHPGPLPLLAGGMPFVWPVLRPDLFKLCDYRPTAHYMTQVVDEGPIILMPDIELPEGVNTANVTATQIQLATMQAMCRSMDEVVKLVKDGYKGTAASPLPPGYTKDMARRPSDHERTISSDMTVEQADRIWRARQGAQSPFFRRDYGLYKIIALRPVATDSREAIIARQRASGAYRTGTRIVQTFRDGSIELGLRKL